MWELTLNRGELSPLAAGKIQRKQSGDPYGNRTRASAVKGYSPLFSKAVPHVRDLFRSMYSNGLAALWELSKLHSRKWGYQPNTPGFGGVA